MTSLKTKVNRANRRINKKGASDTFRGTLGATIDGVFYLYTDALNQYYVTRADGSYESVYNAIAPPEPGLEVECGRMRGKRYLQVIDFDYETLAALGRKIGAPPHKQQHEMRLRFGQSTAPTVNELGPDAVFLSALQLTNFSLAPHSGMVVKALAGVFEIDGVPYWSEGGLLTDTDIELENQSLDPPDTEKSKLCLVEENSAGTFYYAFSDDFDTTTSIPAILSNTPAPTGGRGVRGLLLIINGETKLGWNRILPLGNIRSSATANVAVMVGATDEDDGAVGLVPQPLAGDENKFLRGDGTWADPPAPVIERQSVFHVSGTLVVGAGSFEIYNNFSTTQTITEVMIAVHTVPTGSAIIVDVNKNGTTIFSNQAHRPQIAVSTKTGTTTDIDVNTLAPGDYLAVDVDQIGSTIAGANLTVHVVMQG